MLRKFFKNCALIFTSVLTLYSCATITPVSGNFTTTTPIEAQNREFFGKTVRFGGTIISTIPEQNNTTCFVVLSLKLHSNGRPYAKKPENFVGRFMACANGYYDPQIYQKNKKITFIGTISGTQKKKVGNFTYTYPVLNVKNMYLWPKYIENTSSFPYDYCPSYSFISCPY